VAKLQPERVTCPACGARRRKKMVGELDAGNSRVQFDEGAQETCGSATRLCPTLPKPLPRLVTISLGSCRLCVLNRKTGRSSGRALSDRVSENDKSENRG